MDRTFLRLQVHGERPPSGWIAWTRQPRVDRSVLQPLSTDATMLERLSVSMASVRGRPPRRSGCLSCPTADFPDLWPGNRRSAGRVLRELVDRSVELAEVLGCGVYG